MEPTTYPAHDAVHHRRETGGRGAAHSKSVSPQRDMGGLHAQAGLSLLELLMVVILTAILVGVAFAAYHNILERGYYREAQAVLKSIYTGQRARWHAQGAYLDNPSTMSEWRLLRIDNPNVLGLPVTFAVTVTGDTFDATATRNTEGPCADMDESIDENAVVTGTWAACSVL